MPKRSNEFQKLIYLLHSHFSSNAAVTESKMVRDRLTGKEVEVDIVIDTTVSSYPISVAIECISESRPATVEWVNEMKGKHDSLPLDKLILVSQSGFTANAREKAIGYGLEVLTLSDAEDTNWVNYVASLANLRFAGFSFTIEKFELRLVSPEKLRSPDLMTRDCPIKEPSADARGTVNDYAAGIPRQPAIVKGILERWIKSLDRSPDYRVNVTWQPPNGTVVIDLRGSSHEVKSLECQVHVHVSDTPMRLSHAQLQGKNVAYGFSENVFQNEGKEKFAVVFEEKEGTIGSGSIMLPPSQGGGIKPITLPDEANNLKK